MQDTAVLYLQSDDFVRTSPDNMGNPLQIKTDNSAGEKPGQKVVLSNNNCPSDTGNKISHAHTNFFLLGTLQQKEKNSTRE